MEASGGAVEQAAEGQDEQAVAPEVEADGQPDVGQRLDDLMDRFERWEQRQQEQQQQDPQFEPYDPYQSQQPQQGYEDYPPEQQAALEQEYLQNMMREAAQEAIAPWIEKQEEQRRQEEIELLEEEFPELKDGRTARSVVQAAQKAAQTLGQPQLAGEPGFVELIYKARKADQRAADEQPAGTQPAGVQLEHSGGVSPPAPEEDEAMRIINAGGRNGGVFG